MKWLASHPGYTLAEPLRHLDYLAASKLQKITPAIHSRTVLPSFVTGLLFQNLGAYLIAFAAEMVSAIVAVVSKLSSRALAVAWCVIGISVALFYVVWLGSAIEGARHAIVASTASRVGILLVLAFTADLYLAARQKTLATADVSQEPCRRSEAPRDSA